MEQDFDILYLGIHTKVKCLRVLIYAYLLLHQVAARRLPESNYSLSN